MSATVGNTLVSGVTISVSPFCLFSLHFPFVFLHFISRESVPLGAAWEEHGASLQLKVRYGIHRRLGCTVIPKDLFPFADKETKHGRG